MDEPTRKPLNVWGLVSVAIMAALGVYLTARGDYALAVFCGVIVVVCGAALIRPVLGGDERDRTP